MRNLILCGRYDCQHEDGGRCCLNTIAIGKDCTCQLFQGVFGDKAVQFKKELLNKNNPSNISSSNEPETVFKPIPLREQI